MESDQEVRLFTVLNFRMGCCSKFRSLLIADSQDSGGSCFLKRQTAFVMIFHKLFIGFLEYLSEINI
jgi:hypothetical protein